MLARTCASSPRRLQNWLRTSELAPGTSAAAPFPGFTLSPMKLGVCFLLLCATLLLAGPSQVSRVRVESRRSHLTAAESGLARLSSAACSGGGGGGAGNAGGGSSSRSHPMDGSAAATVLDAVALDMPPAASRSYPAHNAFEHPRDALRKLRPKWNTSDFPLILCVGHGKTATKSLNKAFVMLGMHTAHFYGAGVYGLLYGNAAEVSSPRLPPHREERRTERTPSPSAKLSARTASRKRLRTRLLGRVSSDAPLGSEERPPPHRMGARTSASRTTPRRASTWTPCLTRRSLTSSKRSCTARTRQLAPNRQLSRAAQAGYSGGAGHSGGAGLS